ncbi:MAG: hypothetical protein EBT15_04035 [Betaproteobacteria bacterium]|nr:hypothetical protein [Betaproteobacteria bacterium]
MRSKISKATRTIVENTVARWLETINEGRPNVTKASDILRAAYESGLGSFRRDRYKKSPVTFYVAKSPVTFMISMAVVRGRMTKTYARELCKQLEIDSAFLIPLRKDSLLGWNSDRRRWWSNMQNNEFTRTWLRAIREEYMSNEKLVANSFGLSRRWWRNRGQSSEDVVLHKTNNLAITVNLFRSMLNDTIGLESVTESFRSWDGSMRNNEVLRTEKKISEIANKIIFDSSSTAGAIGELNRVVSITELNNTSESIADDGVWLGSVPQAIDAEILCKLLKIDDPTVTWEHEVFHHCTAFAAFQSSCVVLADRPQIGLNESGNLHSTTGPAVQWADGVKLWFNDGHFMNEGGRKIVERPEQLTTAHIMRIRNEETRRLAIERFGWDRFIAEADCPVLDSRVNDIDNTTEMLVGPPRGQENRTGQNRMVLFCRSTGRRYFISVPRDISTCAEAQSWMADAGTTARVPYAANPVRVIGAS